LELFQKGAETGRGDFSCENNKKIKQESTECGQKKKGLKVFG
jgi:hypothetical protein